MRLARRSKRSTAGRLRSTRPDVRQAEDLAAAGKLFEAIAGLVAANRAEPDPAIERRLVDLRFAAFAQGERPPGLASWPPVVPDLFPGVVEPPEVRAEDVTVDVLRSAILRHGSLIVRGFLERDRAEELVAETDRVFAAQDAWMAGAEAVETEPWYQPLDWYPDTDRRWARDGGGVLAVESPRAFFDLIETFETRNVRDLATGYLGEAPALLANKWTFRRVPATANDADWHQDGSFMGKEVRSLNLWVTLSDCGVDAPGLDIVARRLEGIVDTGTDGAALDWTVGPGMVDRVAEGMLQRPVFAAGDAMFFDHLFLHRTGIHPGMTKDRYAIEAWFAAPSSYPEKQLPIAY